MLFGGACAHFGTGSFGAGVALTDPVGRLADAANHHPDVDPAGRGPSFWFQQIDAPRPQRNRTHIDISVPYDRAETRIAPAIAAGGHLVTEVVTTGVESTRRQCPTPMLSHD